MPLDASQDQSDDALLAAYAEGDLRAARVLTLRLTPRVLAFATRVLRDAAEAEDVTQESLLRLWRMAPQWTPGKAKVTTWVFRVAANLCTDRLRRSGRSVNLDAVEEPVDEAKGAEAALIDGDRADALRAALQTLPERQRQAVVLRHLEGLSNPEIAEVMDIGTEAVESLTARAKRSLAAKLAGRREELGYDDA